ncbi:MAG TPA: EamA family transporter [Candidatus Solibacter sp.]|jgi:inner membrane transporter RhtA|nr:EamA family transporter [Candidatus Solibacter sp.]
MRGIDRDSDTGRRLTAAGLVVGSAFSAQLGAAYAVSLIQSSTPAMAAMLRNLVGATVLVGLLLLRRGSLRGLDLKPALALGLILGVMNTSFYAAIARLPLGDAVAVEFAGPIAVAAITSSVRRELLWVALAAAGVLAISHPGPDHLSYAGLAFVLLAGACWGAYILVGRRVAVGGRRSDTLALAMVGSAAVLVVPALLQAAPLLGRPGFLALGVGVGVLSSAIPYSVELIAMERVPPTVFGVLLSLQPFMAAVMGLLVLGQHVSALEAIGLLLVIAASVGVTLGGRDPSVATEPVAA